MLRYVVYFLAIALALPMSLWVAPVKGIGMWVWSESSANFGKHEVVMAFLSG